MKILLHNFSYALGGSGRYRDYLSQALRLGKPKKQKEFQALVALQDMIEDEDVNIACICEIHSGRQIEQLSSGKLRQKSIANKYGNRPSL